MAALTKVTHKSHWIGVASHDHVLGAVQGGFCQLGHGKEALVRRLKAGDLIVFYSPRELMGSGPVLLGFHRGPDASLTDLPTKLSSLRAFVHIAAGQKFFKSRQAPVWPLLQELTFTQGNESWGLAFRRGAFRITADDFKRIAEAMSIKSEDTYREHSPRVTE